jgi:SnoaL-like domain
MHKVSINSEVKTMANINQIVVSYLAAWNERDGKRRRDIVAKTWAEDGTYVDRVRHGEGHGSIADMIGAAQEHFPGYQLCLASSIETHGAYVRFSWQTVGSAQAPLRIAGTDFATIAKDGRLKSVVGFVDAAPAPVAS